MSSKYSVSPARLAMAITASLSASQLSAATITVDTLADPGSIEECSLRAAIEAVNTQAAVDYCAAGDGIDDTIQFAPGLTGTITLNGSSLLVSSDVSIVGPGAANLAIDANQASRVVQVQNYATATISGLTFQGGSADYGAGVYITGAYVSLQDCVIQNNQASGFGGGIELFGGSLSAAGCSFLSNSAGFQGGALAVTQGYANVYSSDFQYNSATFGGGVQVPDQQSGSGPQGGPGAQGAYLLLEGSIITGNTAEIGGGVGAGRAPYSGKGEDTQGVIPPPGGAPNLVINNSEISDNQAYLGGGIAAYLPSYLQGASNAISVTSSLISSNSASAGGGIAGYGPASIELEGSVVSENQAVYGGGGLAIYGSGPGGPTPTTTRALESRWGSEGALGRGLPVGGLYSRSSLIEGNAAPSGGGVITRGASSIFFLSQVSSNLGGGIEINNAYSYFGSGQLTGNQAAEVGGLDCRNGSTCLIYYASVTDNVGYLVGGLRSGLGGPQTAPQGLTGSLAVVSSTISSNQGSQVGGAYATPLTLRHSTVALNQQSGPATRGGATGGLLIGDGSLIDHSVIADNLAAGSPSDVRSLGANPTPANYSLVGNSTGFNYAGTGNLIDVDPLLGPLAANGASYSLTHALLAGSPAINAGDPALANTPTYDQRGPGFDRVVGGVIDIGAFEADGAPAEPDVGLSVSSIDFSGLLIGLNDSAPLTITSTGTGSLDLGQLNVSVTRGGIFGLANDTCSNQSLAPLASCTVDVTFQPPALGAFNGAVVISSNAPSSPDLVPISGVGVAPVLNLTSSTVDFGTVSVGATGIGSTTVRNTGTAPLTFSATDTAPPFSVSAGAGLCLDGGATVLAANESCTLSFSFDPTTEGPASQLVNLTSDSFGGDSTVQLSGSAVAGPVPTTPTLPVPFMGKAGTALLTGLMLLLGLFGVRRITGS